jgi:hypothetical protein
MSNDDRRTPEQIRAEIVDERGRLDSEVAALGAEAKRAGRIAGSALATVGSVVFFARLWARRRVP